MLVVILVWIVVLSEDAVASSKANLVRVDLITQLRGAIRAIGAERGRTVVGVPSLDVRNALDAQVAETLDYLATHSTEVRDAAVMLRPDGTEDDGLLLRMQATLRTLQSGVPIWRARCAHEVQGDGVAPGDATKTQCFDFYSSASAQLVAYVDDLASPADQSVPAALFAATAVHIFIGLRTLEEWNTLRGIGMSVTDEAGTVQAVALRNLATAAGRAGGLLSGWAPADSALPDASQVFHGLISDTAAYTKAQALVTAALAQPAGSVSTLSASGWFAAMTAVADDLTKSHDDLVSAARTRVDKQINESVRGLTISLFILLLPLWAAAGAMYLDVRARQRDAMRQKMEALAAEQMRRYVSHEIRNPLHGMSAALDLLVDKDFEDETAELLRVMYRCTRSISGIVNSSLDYSKWVANRFRVSPRRDDLREVVGDVLYQLRYVTHVPINPHVHSGVPRSAVFDGERVRQVASNLISNAIKATRQGRIAVCVSIVQVPQWAVDAANSDDDSDARAAALDAAAGMGAGCLSTSICGSPAEVTSAASARRLAFASRDGLVETASAAWPGSPVHYRDGGAQAAEGAAPASPASGGTVERPASRRGSSGRDHRESEHRREALVSMVLIEVVDTGSGLGGADPASVFEEFTSARAVAGAPQLSGAGLGMPLCRRIVGAMGGEMGIEDRFVPPNDGADAGGPAGANTGPGGGARAAGGRTSSPAASRRSFTGGRVGATGSATEGDEAKVGDVLVDVGTAAADFHTWGMIVADRDDQAVRNSGGAGGAADADAGAAGLGSGESFASASAVGLSPASPTVSAAIGVSASSTTSAPMEDDVSGTPVPGGPKSQRGSEDTGTTSGVSAADSSPSIRAAGPLSGCRAWFTFPLVSPSDEPPKGSDDSSGYDHSSEARRGRRLGGLRGVTEHAESPSDLDTGAAGKATATSGSEADVRPTVVHRPSEKHKRGAGQRRGAGRGHSGRGHARGGRARRRSESPKGARGTHGHARSDHSPLSHGWDSDGHGDTPTAISVRRPHTGRSKKMAAVEMASSVLEAWGRPPRVLMVDDERFNRRIGKRALFSIGCDCSTVDDCGDIERTLAAAKKAGTPIDVVFTDINTPRVSGDVVVARMRAAGDVTPMVAVTGMDEPGAMEVYREAGFDAVLRKPFQREDMVAQLLAFAALRAGAGPSAPATRDDETTGAGGDDAEAEAPSGAAGGAGADDAASV